MYNTSSTSRSSAFGSTASTGTAASPTQAASTATKVATSTTVTPTLIPPPLLSQRHSSESELIAQLAPIAGLSGTPSPATATYRQPSFSALASSPSRLPTRPDAMPRSPGLQGLLLGIGANGLDLKQRETLLTRLRTISSADRLACTEVTVSIGERAPDIRIKPLLTEFQRLAKASGLLDLPERTSRSAALNELYEQFVADIKGTLDTLRNSPARHDLQLTRATSRSGVDDKGSVKVPPVRLDSKLASPRVDGPVTRPEPRHERHRSLPAELPSTSRPETSPPRVVTSTVTRERRASLPDLTSNPSVAALHASSFAWQAETLLLRPDVAATRELFKRCVDSGRVPVEPSERTTMDSKISDLEARKSALMAQRRELAERIATIDTDIMRIDKASVTVLAPLFQRLTTVSVSGTSLTTRAPTDSR